MDPDTTRTILISATIFFVLSCPCGFLSVSYPFVEYSGMPVWIPNLIVLGSLSFPTAVLLAIPSAWLAYRWKKNDLAVFLSLFPLLIVIFPVVGWIAYLAQR